MTGQVRRVQDAKHCSCGASIRLTTSSLKAADDLVALFAQLHHGDGHRPATADQAAAARRREERR